MIARLRLLLVLTRPAVIVLLALFAAIGQAAAGAARDYGTLAAVLASVLGFLLFSVAINDLSDEAIDRVNLAGNRRRPLVTGAATHADLYAVAAAGLLAALGAAVWLGPRVLITTLAGLLLSAGYSVRPVRLADRSALAALMLPACYVAVPYLDGFFAIRSAVRAADLVLLVGLYLGFIGRIVLKDFRDVRGDALFGKRTFLVRYGRVWTCRFSGLFWLSGTMLAGLSLGRGALALDVAYGFAAAVSIWLLRGLARDAHPVRDERRITALAIVGRGVLLALLAQITMQQRGWPVLGSVPVLVWLALATTWLAWSMLARGPRPLLTSAALHHISASERRRGTIVAG